MKWLWSVFLIVSLGLLACFVWPTRYRYEHSHQSVLVRIDRFSGETAYYHPGKGWQQDPRYVLDPAP